MCPWNKQIKCILIINNSTAWSSQSYTIYLSFFFLFFNYFNHYSSTIWKYSKPFSVDIVAECERNSSNHNLILTIHSSGLPVLLVIILAHDFILCSELLYIIHSLLIIIIILKWRQQVKLRRNKIKIDKRCRQMHLLLLFQCKTLMVVHSIDIMRRFINVSLNYSLS